MGFWRHVIEKVPITNDPQYWSLVFPIGMYAACTFMLSKALAPALSHADPEYRHFFCLYRLDADFPGNDETLVGIGYLRNALPRILRKIAPGTRLDHDPMLHANYGPMVALWALLTGPEKMRETQFDKLAYDNEVYACQ